ncbi:hypothetical protein VTL71DRAFT_13398 [Oculimacula yallundae]|uniref:Uncharacterized protein n=1 Tax=Oculimacula yallundae TaxID=86028 RepID=A0ABR4CK84_9HELO
MQAQQTTSEMDNSASVHRATDSGALHGQVNRNAMALISPAIMSVSRLSSPRLSHGNTVLDTSSRMIQAPLASPSLPHPLVVSRSTPHPETQVISSPRTQSGQNPAEQSSAIRGYNSRASHHRRAYVLEGFVYNSGLTGEIVLLPRPKNFLSKSPRYYSRKEHRPIRIRVKALMRLLMSRRERLAAQKPLVISSPLNPIHIEDAAGVIGLKMVRLSALVVEDRGHDRTLTTAIEDHSDRAEISNPVLPSDLPPARSNISHFDDPQAEIQRLKQEISDLQEENSRLKTSNLDIAQQLEEAQMLFNSQLVLAEHSEAKYKVMSAQSDRFEDSCKKLLALERSRGLMQRSASVQGQVNLLKQSVKELEARHVAEHSKSNERLALSKHYEMLYVLEKQARVAASATHAPMAPIEGNLWGAQQDPHADLIRDGTRNDMIDYEALSEEWSESASFHASGDVDIVPYHREVMPPTTNEADNPPVDPRIADFMSQADFETEVPFDKDRTFALRQQLPGIYTSQSDTGSYASNFSSRDDNFEPMSPLEPQYESPGPRIGFNPWYNEDDDFSDFDEDEKEDRDTYEKNIYQLPAFSFSASILDLPSLPNPDVGGV